MHLTSPNAKILPHVLMCLAVGALNYSLVCATAREQCPNGSISDWESRCTSNRAGKVSFALSHYVRPSGCAISTPKLVLKLGT